MSFEHSFVVCAYKESPHLEDCLASLAAQTANTSVTVITSTPNEYISAAAQKFGFSVTKTGGKSGIARDWNFAMQTAKTEYMTIAHQDDVYFKDYVKTLDEYAARAKNPLILFTDYGELRGAETVFENKLLNIKRKMNAFLKPRIFWGSRFMRRRVLSFGSSICCPSVCYHKSALGSFSFDESFSCDLDWDAWSRIAQMKGDFVYVPRALMAHRIHKESETTRLLSDGNRFAEDELIFRRYWSEKTAKRIMRHYAKSAQSNETKQ